MQLLTFYVTVTCNQLAKIRVACNLILSNYIMYCNLLIPAYIYRPTIVRSMKKDVDWQVEVH